jgi:hypothetical protein
VVGDSTWSTSPFSGALLDPTSKEGAAFGNVLNRYHIMKLDEAELQYYKACGSAEDVRRAEQRLKDATDTFNQSLEDYIYGFSAQPGASGFPSLGPLNLLGYPQLHGKNEPRTPDQQKTFDGVVSAVMAQLAKDDKQEPISAQCPPKTTNTLPGPTPGSNPSTGTGTSTNPSPSPGPSASPSPSPSSGGNAGGSVKTLIGIVLPADTRPGDTATATVVKDPQSYSGVPGLRVIQATVPLTTDAQGEVSLAGLVVNTGDGQPQPASQPLKMNVPANAAALNVVLGEIGSDTPLDTETVPLTPAAPTPETAIWEPSKVAQIPATAYTTAPAEEGGAVQAIHGPVSGDSVSTQVLVDGRPSTIVAESPRAAYWELPTNTAPGAHKLTVVEDGNVMSSFHVAVVDLRLNAKDLRLVKNQSTEFSATVDDGNAVAASAWQPGMDSDLVEPKTASELLPEKAGSPRPAAIVLQIQNKSPETIKLAGAKANMITIPLEQKDFTNGTYTVSEKIQSVRSGTFNITAEVIPLLAPIHGEALPVQTQTEETTSTSRSSTATAPPQTEIPVALPSKPTALELSHTTAYFVASTHQLHIRNSAHFLQGVRSGKFLVTWSTGSSTATIREADGSTVHADVIADDPKDNPQEPKIGDIKFVENEKINSVDENTGACEKVPALFSDKQFLGRRQVRRHYTELVDSGNDSGTESYQVIVRNYFYDATDCSSGGAGTTDVDQRFVLTVGSWPKQ